MIEIDETDYCIRLTYSGEVDEAEMAADVDRAVEAVGGQPEGFCVLADMRDLVVLTDDVAKELGRLMRASKENGHDRTAAVVDAATLKLQLRRLSKESRDDESFRFFEPDDHDDWHRVAVDWLRS